MDSEGQFEQMEAQIAAAEAVSEFQGFYRIQMKELNFKHFYFSIWGNLTPEYVPSSYHSVERVNSGQRICLFKKYFIVVSPSATVKPHDSEEEEEELEEEKRGGVTWVSKLAALCWGRSG